MITITGSTVKDILSQLGVPTPTPNLTHTHTPNSLSSQELAKSVADGIKEVHKASGGLAAAFRSTMQPSSVSTSGSILRDKSLFGASPDATQNLDPYEQARLDKLNLPKSLPPTFVDALDKNVDIASLNTVERIRLLDEEIARLCLKYDLHLPADQSLKVLQANQRYMPGSRVEYTYVSNPGSAFACESTVVAAPAARDHNPLADFAPKLPPEPPNTRPEYLGQYIDFGAFGAWSPAERDTRLFKQVMADIEGVLKHHKVELKNLPGMREVFMQHETDKRPAGTGNVRFVNNITI